MFRTAFRSVGIVVVLLVLIASAPVAWADPGERGRARSDRADERRPDRSDEEPPDDGGEAAEEEHDDEESPGRDDTPPRSEREGASGADQAPPEESASDLADALDITFSGSPARIAAGEISTLTMTAANSGDQTIRSLELLVELPPNLELVSAEPAVAHGNETLVVPLGALPAGETVEATLVVRALDAPRASSSPVRFALVADDQIFHHEVMVEVDADGSEGLQLAQSGPLLVQVGDVGAFRLRISNTGEVPLRDVAVVTEIAPELDVVGVTPIQEADAIQLGSSPSTEDVVWIFHELDPAETVDLFWTARAAVPGDLEANTETVALVDGHEVADSVQRTYLGYVEALQVEREEDPAPVVQQRVVTKLVPVSREVAAGVAGLLPVTGVSPLGLTGAGILFVALGAACLWLSGRTRSMRRGGLVALGALLLVTTACVSDPQPEVADTGSPERQEITEPPQDEVALEDEPEDEVLGVRIERDPPPADAGASDEDDRAETTSPEQLPPQTEVVFEEVTVVESVLVAPAPLPAREMGSRSGDNVVSITWERDSESLTAVSSRTVALDATEELLTSVVASGPRLTATVTLRNVAEDRLAATGRLRLEIEQGETASTLYSERVEVVLDPGEEVSADFTFSLPEGSFALRGGFEPY